MIIKVSAALALQRLDRILTQVIPGVSRSEARRLILSRLVRVEGRAVKKGLLPQVGDKIEVPDSVLERNREITPNSGLNIEIIHEDEALLVVNKKACLPCHPIRIEECQTVANGLIARYPYLKGVGFSSLQPGLVNRLDTKTSGIIVVAKNDEVFHTLRAMFKNNLVKKGYIALVHGSMRLEGEIDLCIANQAGKKTKVKVLNSQETQRAKWIKARRAITHVRILKRLAVHTLLEVQLITGVRHQVRAHLSFLGYPLVGDTLYGAKEQLITSEGERYFLHAHYLGFDHPIRRYWIEFNSPLPSDLRKYLAQIS